MPQADRRGLAHHTERRRGRWGADEGRTGRTKSRRAVSRGLGRWAKASRAGSHN